MAQLICEDLTLGYEGQEILSHLSFSVEKGDYLCIIGENGSGKTTLMKAAERLAICRSKAPFSAIFRLRCAKSCSRAFRDSAVCARFITGKKSGRRTKIWRLWALPT